MPGRRPGAGSELAPPAIKGVGIVAGELRVNADEMKLDVVDR